VGVAAAAVVVAIAIRARPVTTDRHVAQERAATSNAALVVAVSPIGATVRRADLRFVWRRDDQSTGYRVTVDNASGVPVWQHDVADTSAAPPASLRLDAGARYFWHVDALRADGTTIKSAAPAFQIRPE
jgi:hypothetical protein